MPHRFIKIFGLSMVFLASIGFVFLGMGDLQFGSSAKTVAEVDGKKISQTDWDTAHQNDINRILDANPNLSLSALDTPAMRYAALQRLVRDRVLAAAAQHEHLNVSDARLAATLAQDPQIAALRDANGQIDMERYKRLVGAQGLTPEGFEARVRGDLARQQVLGGIAASEVASTAQINASLDPLRERREINIVRFQTADYAAKIEPTEAELQEYYKTHAAQHEAPESVDIDYITLDLANIKKTVEVNDEELHQYYEQNKASFGTPEERSARHILIAVAPDASAAQRDEAKAKAEKILAEARANPDDFAALARKDSDDSASAEHGGDLGFFQENRGMDPAIAKATFALQKIGDISDLVSSDFGWHIIQLDAIKPAEIPPFAELKPTLEDQFRTQEAQRRFTELADEFTNSVYEQAQSLKPTAEKLGLPIETASGVTRTPAPGATGALANAKFLDALFSADALDNEHNTEAIEIGANQLASGHVTKHIAAHAKPYEDVQADVRARYIAEHGAEQARAAGEKQLAAWQQQPDSATDLPEAITVSRQKPEGQSLDLIEAAMRANSEKLPAFAGVDLGADGYAVVRVDKVLAPEPETEAETQDNEALYDRIWSNAEAQSLYDYLKRRYKAKILVPAPTGVAPEA